MLVPSSSHNKTDVHSRSETASTSPPELDEMDTEGEIAVVASTEQDSEAPAPISLQTQPNPQ